MYFHSSAFFCFVLVFCLFQFWKRHRVADKITNPGPQRKRDKCKDLRLIDVSQISSAAFSQAPREMGFLQPVRGCHFKAEWTQSVAPRPIRTHPACFAWRPAQLNANFLALEIDAKHTNAQEIIRFDFMLSMIFLEFCCRLFINNKVTLVSIFYIFNLILTPLIAWKVYIRFYLKTFIHVTFLYGV